MRKALLIIAVVLTTACAPSQVAMLRGSSTVTQRDVKIANAVNEVERTRNHSSDRFMTVARDLHNEPFLACTRAHESDTAGGYNAYNRAGPWIGAYQFLQSTWNNTASHAGWRWLVGVDPRAAGPFWQDMTAMHLYQWQGKGPWGGRC